MKDEKTEVESKPEPAGKGKEYRGEVERPKVGRRPLGVSVTFRQNRRFELHVGRGIIHFEPGGTQMLDRAIVEHPDFKQVAKLFVIKGA